jgi:hypothetical protein
MKRIKKIGVLQTSKVLAVHSFFIAFIVAMFFIVWYLTDDTAPVFTRWLNLQLLIILPITTFISTSIFCLIFNLAAKWTGGIEIYFEESDDQERVEENK